jgi:sugar phosphate permease
VAFALLVTVRGERLEGYLASGLLGVGLGLAMAALATLIVSNVAQDETGAAAGINNVARTLGGALGGQIAAVLLLSGYTSAFTVGLVAMIAAVFVGPLLPGIGGPHRALVRARAAVGRR